MGDRSVTIFHDGDEDYSPGVYLHWEGSNTVAHLKGASDHMRKGDPLYSAARFCGYLHTVIHGNTGLGLLNPPKEGESLDDYSHGDSGVYVVDVSTGDVSHHDGQPSGVVVTLALAA